MKIHALIALARERYAKFSHREKTNAGILVVVFGLLLIVLLFKGCSAFMSSTKAVKKNPIMIHHGQKIIIPEHSALRSQIVVKTVNDISIPHIVSIPGVVEADPTRTVNILPPLPGRLMNLKVGLGDKVQANQVLAVISSPGLAQAYADRDKASSVLKLADETLKRTKKVFQAGANSIKDIESATNNYVQAVTELKRAELTLKTLGNKGFNLLNIKSPISGRVTALNYGIGSFINDQTAALLTISNIDSVWVTANVPENLVGVVAKDQRVKVILEAYPKQILSGKVAFVNSILEPDSRRNKTRITFLNPDQKLEPNMFATVKISVEQPKLVMIPNSAILMNDDTTSVYVETAPWTFVRRSVALGSEDAGKVRVLSGLNPGDKVVITGGIFVND